MPLPFKIVVAGLLFGWQAVGVHPGSAADAAGGEQVLNRWLQRQSEIQTWAADVRQIRKLKTLAQPLEAEGRVWFSRPNRFRWQLGDPPRTVIVRTRDALWIEYPRLKRVEKFPLTGGPDSRWRYIMALVDVGFPEDAQTFYATYSLTGARNIGDIWRIDLQPLSVEARKLLDSVSLEISVPDLLLRTTELAFPDGSVMRNEFGAIEVNPPLKPGLFVLEIPPDYQVVNPLADRQDGGR